jgi:hypothetical protein
MFSARRLRMKKYQCCVAKTVAMMRFAEKGEGERNNTILNAT